MAIVSSSRKRKILASGPVSVAWNSSYLGGRNSISFNVSGIHKDGDNETFTLKVDYDEFRHIVECGKDYISQYPEGVKHG